MHLEGEGRIVRQHPHRVGVDVDTVLHGLYHDRPPAVRDHPVQGRRRQVLLEGGVRQVQPGQQALRLVHVGALA